MLKSNSANSDGRKGTPRTVLTPCRRIGLSRTKKTPKLSSLSQVESPSPISTDTTKRNFCFQEKIGETSPKRTKCEEISYSPLDRDKELLTKQPEVKKVHKKLEKFFSEGNTTTDKDKKFKRCLSLLKAKADNIETEETGRFLLQSNRKLTHSLSEGQNALLSDSDCEDDSFASSQVNVKKEKASIIERIDKLTKEVKQKEDKLSKLKQAEIYRHKHDINKLKQLTEEWLEGCRTGLKDLLILLKEHGPIEMDSLLKRLLISVDIVEKLNF